MFDLMREEVHVEREAGAKQNTGEWDREGRYAGKAPIARSTFMEAEEIDREREQSGWNPYAGEEENTRADREQDADGTRPYFSMTDYAEITEGQRIEERELRKLQSMYPDAAKLLLPYVEEECDKMEYEGSPMFDEYPDRTTVYRVEERVYEQVKDRFPEEKSRKPEEVLLMQYSGPGAGAPGRNWARDLARVLLLQEMHHRRRRHRAVAAQQYLPFHAVSGIV